MKITIDCRMINASGIGVYLRGILPYVLQSKNDFFLLGKSLQLQPFTSYTNVYVIECDIKPFSIRELFFFPLQIRKKINSSCLFFTPFINIPSCIKIPVITTIHDLAFYDITGLTSSIGLIIRKWFFHRAYRISNKIFTVSHFSKSRIEYHFGSKKPVIVTYSAIQQIFIDYRKNAKNIAKNNTIVFTGNIKKHKGLDCLLNAFIAAREQGFYHKLVIIGEKDKFRSSDINILKTIESIKSQSNDNIIEFTGFISNDKLMEYISRASLLIQPSFYEGFGLPPLEAMILGTQALISDIPVFREIYDGFPVIFFKPGDPEDLKEKMLDILKQDSNKKISLPEQLESKYTFQKCSSVILSNLNT